MVAVALGILISLLPCIPSMLTHDDQEMQDMWQELQQYCEQGMCTLHTGSTRKMDPTRSTTIDCKGRLLAYEYALKLLPQRKPLREVFDALELEKTCGITPPKGIVEGPILTLPKSATNSFWVDYNHGSDHTGTGKATAPFKTIQKALDATRRVAGPPGTIILKAGVHFLSDTLSLGAADSGLTITRDPAAATNSVWVSGGVPLVTKWKKVPDTALGSRVAKNVWVADLSGQVSRPFNGLNTMAGQSLTGTYSRVTRARFPSGNIEDCVARGQRGCWNNGVKHWHRDLSCVGKARTVYKDLRACDDRGQLLNGHGPCKNDSAMWPTYNTYSNGHGGCCAIWSGDDSPYGPMGDYFCGNSSAGGWVGYDDPRGHNRSQGLSPAMPVGFDYDPKKYPFLHSVRDPAGAVMHVWRDQGWFVNMFEVSRHDANDNAFDFAMVRGRDGTEHVKGGWQGGRGWQVNKSAINSTKDDKHDYLLAGKWMMENLKEALDDQNEWWLDAATNQLYVIPNATTASGAPAGQFIAVMLKTLVSVNATMAKPARGITIQGVGFRDAADIVMEPWGVPSGGDWGLYRGGAVFFEGAENCTVAHCTFERIDGNGVFLSGYTRNVTVSDCEFAWVGDSAMAGWGYTRENDGTDGQQPRFTYLLRNYVREIGLIEKQSSMWFQAKACQTVIDRNVIFNGPRAGINFNDGFGGGTNVSNNLIFNQCRESGDHGPINSWDRTAYISKVATGEPSYRAKTNNIRNNFVIANYGSSQGFDTDDGSSWYNIHDNFFFMADAWKMDYGGHDSQVHDNVIYHGHNDGQNCVNSWPFLPGHGATYTGNKCVLPRSTNIGNLFHGCDCPGTASNSPWVNTSSPNPKSECGIEFSQNQYFTENGTATVNCGPKPDWQDWTHKFGNDKGSALAALPSDDQLLSWARKKLDM